MANAIKVTVSDIKKSSTGKSDVISLYQDEEIKTAFGLQRKTRWYNTCVKPGKASVAIDQVLELDLNDYEIEESLLDNGKICYWITPKS